MFACFMPYRAKNLKLYGSALNYSTISKWSSNLENVVFIEFWVAL